MARRFTFFCLFYSVFILAGFAQQIDWISRADVNRVYGGDEGIHGFCRDKTGNFYVIMQMQQQNGLTIPFNFFGTMVTVPNAIKKYYLLGKFDSTMNLLWAKPFRTDSHGMSPADNLTTDDAGSVYYIHTDTTYKLSPTGNLVWKKAFSGIAININSQNQLEVYHIKNALNSIGSTTLNNTTSVLAFLDTAGNYVRHINLQNPAYNSQVILGKNKTGYYGIRSANQPPIATTRRRQEFFTCDSIGNILKTSLLNHNYFHSSGTYNTNMLATAFDPVYDSYYISGLFMSVEPINKRDSTSFQNPRYCIIQLNRNLEITKVLYLGAPQNVTVLGQMGLAMRTHNGNLYFSGRASDNNTTYKFFTHFGILNKAATTSSNNTLVGKLDRNLNLIWYIPVGNKTLQFPMPTSDGIYVCGTLNNLVSKQINFPVTFNNHSDAFIMKITDKDSTSATITGKLFHDLNQNGVDDNEPGLTGYSISSNTVGGVAYSVSNGFYQTSAVTGLNTLKSNSIPKFWVRTTPDSLQINVPATAAQLNGFNFGMRPVSGIKDAGITLTPLTAARINMPVMYQLTYRNLATDVLNGSIKMVKAPELIFQNASVTPDVISGDTLTWHYASLNPGEIQRLLVKFTVPNNPALNNRYLKSEANITPLSGDTIQENNQSKTYHLITGPLDPNDITVTPSCSIDRLFINDGKFLEYRIRFQNIGTDTAFSVAIHDTLSSFLDQSTLEFVASSHNARFWIKENVLTIFFENIKLPHGAANYPSSHGFFTYRIKPKINTPVFVSIKNKAAIYFDFNEPILTNEAITPVTSYITPFTSTQEHIKCHGDLTGKITINNTCIAAPVRYSLDSISFQPSPIFSQLPGGNYSVWIKTDDKSYKINSVQVQQPDSINAVFTIKHATTFIDGEITINTTGGVAPYSFKLNGTTTSFVGHFGYLAPGTYQVEIKDQNNCTKTYSVVIRNIAGINDQEIEGINIYPNPFTSRLILETGPETGNAQIELYNSVGQVVLVEQVRAAKTILDLEQVPTGVYLLKVTTATGYHTRTVIKK